MYCWSPSSAVHQTAFISPTPSNRPFQYDLLMSQRQPCYFQNQPMFQATRTRGHSATMEYSRSACAKAQLNLGFGSLGSLASPSRLDEPLVYQDPSPEVLNSLPVYFRVKPTLRTPSGKRCRKSRTVFTEMQLKVLEKTFSEQRYLDTTNRAKLAQSLALNETQIKTWFQNRRMKHKKESKTGNEDKDLGPQASCVAEEK